MIIRALDGTGDLTFGQGRNNYLSKNDAIGQNAQCRLLSFLGDCYFSLQDGIDWWNLFGSRNKKIAIELAVNSSLLNSEGIKTVNEISVSVDSNRKIFLSYSADSIYTGVIEGVSPIQAAANYILDQSGQIITDQQGNRISV